MFDYSETCRIAKQYGIFPEIKPSAALLNQLYNVVDDCLTGYIPAPGEDQISGVFVYDDGKQPADVRGSFAYCFETTPGCALIGLSTELLKANMPQFARHVFLHELAHLADFNAGHGEKFQDRANEVYLCYYCTHEGDNVRSDGRENSTSLFRSQLARFKCWKM